MKLRFVPVYILFLLSHLLSARPALAADLTLPNGGLVSIELIFSDAAFRNTLSVVSPAVAVAITGCQLEPADGLAGVRILSEKTSQRGCRVTLDADPATDGIQGFAPGTTLEFNMCAQTDADPACESIWSSNPAENSDDFDHVATTSLFPADYPGSIFRLAWEDLPDGGDQDFNDLVVVVRASVDTDGDGLWDDWERFGVDTDGNGTIDLNLPALGANHLHKDVFVEIDWMDCAVAGGDCAAGDTHSHMPNPAAVTAAINAFANANVSNPDGTTGINLHIDASNSFAHQNFLVIPGACFAAAAGTGFDAVKSDPANFGPQNPRRFAYHYALFTHRQTTTDGGSSGCGELPGNDFQVSLGSWSGQVGTLMDQAGTLLHELGHNLNLRHGGGDNTNFKPNYVSVMSYRYQTSGIPPTDPDGAGPLTARMDYSRQALTELNEASLSEPLGVGDGTDTIFFRCPAGTLSSAPGNGAINWNCNGVDTDTGVSVDVNGDGATSTLTGYFDWGNIKYDFQTTADFDDGLHSPISEMELDRTMFMEEVAADLALTMTASPATVDSGATVTYMLAIENKKPGAAEGVLLLDTLPPETSLVSCAATGGGVCGGSASQPEVAFVAIPGGATVYVTLVAMVDCAVPDGTTITNIAAVEFSAPDPDPDMSDNAAAANVIVTNPPPVITNLTADPSMLWPPDHNMVNVDVDYDVTDNCGVPLCTLSVTSNEPVDGLGDGDTAPDWQIQDAHHTQLRAERSGTGTGRHYETTVQCIDSAGGASADSVTVTVPKSQ